MAAVTKQFRDDFETWAADRVAAGWFSGGDVEEIRATLRRDLAPGPDTLRAGVVVMVGSVPVPAAIDDHEQRYRLWAEFLAGEAEAIRRREKGHAQ